MAYQTGDTILDDEYNNFVTGDGSGAATDSANLNNVWGTGTANRGYGQSTTLSSVSAGTTVTATQWASLLSRITSAANHQGSSIVAMASPSATDVIEIIGAISSNLTTIHTNRLNKAGNGTAVTTNIDSTGSWKVTAEQEITVTFADGDAARYFFNAGGYFTLTPSIVGYTDDAKARSWSALTQMAGTINFFDSSTTVTGETNSITVTEAHTSTSASVSALGYYNLTTSNQIIFDKGLTTAGTPYAVSPYDGTNSSNIKVYAKSNGTQGSNSDNGNIITFTIQYNDGSADDSYDKTDYNVLDEMDGTVRTVTQEVPPSSTYLTASWGTPTIALNSSSHT